MSGGERQRRNALSLREIVSLIETRTIATLGASAHFDVEVKFSVKDSTIQKNVEVNVRYKDRLDGDQDRQ